MLTRPAEIPARPPPSRPAGVDRRERDRLIAAHLGLVHPIARAYLGRGLDLDDLVGEGHLGLIRAAEGYDPARGVRFGTYAGHWIKQAIRRALVERAATIRLPAYMARLLTIWRRAERDLRRRLGRPPDAGEVARELGLTESQRAMVVQARRAAGVRTESSYGGETGDGLLAGVAGRHGAEGPVEEADDRAEARRRLARLEAGERAVLCLRLGLEGEALSIARAARRLGVSPNSVIRAERRALARLREP